MSADKLKILVIDDEATFTKMLRLNLEKTGMFEVREENRGRRGPAVVREFKPDLIFLDVIMPDVDGGEVASQIQADANLKKIPIVFLTATVSRKEVGSGGMKRGGLFFLAKPVTTEQLLECIGKHLKLPKLPPPPANAPSAATPIPPTATSSGVVGEAAEI